LKKLLAIFSILVVGLNTFAEEFDAKDKEVIGKDKWEKDLNLENDKKVEVGKIKDMQGNLDLDMQNIDTYDPIADVGIEEVDIENISGPDSVAYNISVYPSKEIIVNNADINSAPKENYVVFGVGGYDKVDAFRYIVDYTKQDEELSYYLHLGREIEGEFRDNSDIKIDNYFAKVWYKKFNIALSHIINDTEIPGQLDSSYLSKRETRESEVSLEYKVYDNDIDRVYFLGSYYHKGMDADPIRDYSNDYFDLGIKYDTIITTENMDNLIEFDILYINDIKESDNIIDGNEDRYDSKLSSIKADFRDNIKLRSDKTMEFTIVAGVESASKEILDKEVNYNALLKVDKDLSDDLEVGISIEKESMNRANKDLLKGFVFDDDILPVGDIENQDETRGRISAAYIKESLYMNAEFAYTYAKDKVVFAEKRDSSDPGDSFIDGDTVLYMGNHFESLSWLELSYELSYTYSNFRGKLNYKYNSLDEIAFSPKNMIGLDLIYSKDRFETRLEDIYYSSMYDTHEKISENLNNDFRNELDGYNTLNWYNTYKFSDTLEIGFNIKNLLGEDAEYKTGYPIADRKYTLQLKINY